MCPEKIVKSSGNVFVDLGFNAEESAVLTMRSELMTSLRQIIEKKHWTQVEAAQHLGISQSRVSDLVRGKWEKFSLDMLVNLVARSGKKIKLEVE